MSTTTNYGFRRPDSPDSLFQQLQEMIDKVDSTLTTISPGPGGSLADPGGPGIVVRTTTGVTINRQIAAGGQGVLVSNADGTGGNPTISLANDVGAIEALGTTGPTTGYPKRTAADTWAL